MTNTLEEKIENLGLPKAKEALEIIAELQAENQALLAKNIEDAKEHHQDFKAVSEENQALQKKLDEALAKLNEVENENH